MKINFSDNISKIYDDITIDILNHKHTHYWFDGGRGSLKSSFVSLIIVLLIVSNKDVHVLAMRQVAGTLKDSVYSQFAWAIEKLGLESHFAFRKSPLEIIYKKTGQTIYFRGADDPIKLKSIKPKTGYIGITWFEELAEFKGDEVIRSILQSANRGGDKYWNFYSFNAPKSKDHWVNVEKEVDMQGKISHHSNYLTTPAEWLGDEFITLAEHLKTAKPQVYEHEYLGIATGTGGTVFENVESRTITDEEIKALQYFFYGIDFGYAVDPFVWVKIAYDRKKSTIYILDEIYQIKLSNAKAFELIKSKGNDLRAIVTADSAEPKSIQELRDFGLNVHKSKKGKDSVEYGIKWLQDLEKIVIDKKRTPNAHREFTNYEYDVDKYGNFISRYPDKENHCLVGDTIVHTCDGDFKIKDLVGKKGKLFCKGQFNQKTISNFADVRMTRAKADVYKLTLENGKSVTLTADHLIYTNKGWKKVRELEKHHKILTL